MRAKLGLTEARDSDSALVEDLLTRMERNKADFTNTFRDLCHLSGAPTAANPPRTEPFLGTVDFHTWALAWRARLASEGSEDGPRQERMRSVNPAYIPRNHRIEAMLQAAVSGDYGPLETLTTVLASPFEERDGWAAHAEPPAAHEVVRQTFCGT